MVIKKIFTIFFLFFACNVYAFEQGTNIINLSGGLGISTGSADVYSGATVGEAIAGDPSLFSNAEPRAELAVNFGADINYFLTNNLAFLFGFYYDKTPFKTVYPKNTASEDLETIINFTFFTIPVGIRYYSDLFFFGAGFYYGILLNDDAEVKYGSTSADVELQDTHNNFGIFADLGLSGGVNSFFGFIRYKRGLVNVYTDEDMITNVKLIDITLNVGYCFQF